MVYACERRLRVPVSADLVWEWLSDPHHLFGLNPFHRSVQFEDGSLRTGNLYFIHHSIFGLYHQQRVARIRAVRSYHIAWGEFAAEGKDCFPHSQMFTIVPLDTTSSLIKNHLRGKLLIPGGRYWLLPAYRHLAPRILDHENRTIVAAIVGGSATSESPHRPKDSE